MRKTAILYSALLLVGMQAPVFAGWHIGEAKDLDLDIEYFDYAYKDPSGTPVYFIGTPMRYTVTLKNTGNRTFSNFQSKATLHWSDNYSCQRWWYDNQNASYQKDALLPGLSDSGLRTANMRKNDSTTYTVIYPIPLEVCPGDVYVQVEGRHRNESGRDEVAAFTIPVPVKFQKK